MRNETCDIKNENTKNSYLISHISYLDLIRSYDNVPLDPLDNSLHTPQIDTSEIYVTRMEDLIHNPYLYYAKSILGLRRKPDAWEDRTAIEFGNLVHDIIEQKIKDRNLDLVSELNKVANNLFKDHAVLMQFWRKRFIKIADLINEFLSNTNATIYTEIDGKTEIAGRIVRARADIVWSDENGSHIADIKTGAAPSASQLKDGTMPQLPLEALMMSRGAFDVVKNTNNPDILFIQLKRGLEKHIKYDSVQTRQFIDLSLIHI